VGWDAYCEGSLEVEAEVECQAACEASAQVHAICTEPYLTIEVGVDTDDAAMARLKTLVDSLHNQWPAILSIGARVEHTLLPAASALLDASAGLGLAATQAGLEAMACITEAGIALGSAFARVEACVSVSVTLSVSVHTSGNAIW